MSPDGTAARNAFGQPMRRKEDLRLLLGQGRFTADLVAPAMAQAAMVRSAHAHADILGIDIAAAAAMPGVLAVLTGAEYAADGLGGISPGGPLIRLPGTPAEQGFLFRPEHPALARGRVRYVGETVAMVVAETAEQARDAAEAVVVEYAVRPSVTDTAAAARPGAPLVWDAAPGNACFRWQAGDEAAVEAAFAGAAHTVRLETLNNRIHVAAMETRGAIGSYEAGRYTLATGTQMPHGLKEALADEVFRVPRDDMRVTVADVGGSFGIKNALYPEQVLVLWAARRTGRTVAWIGERGDGFLSDYQARDNVYSAELALDGDYRFLALRVASVAAIGAYLAPKGQLSPTANTPALAGVYRLPAIHVAVTGVFSHTAPTEVYRGAGRPESVYLLERLVDHAARELGLDRLELRRRNMLRPAEYPHRTALGLTYDSGDFPRMIDTALLRADHAGFPARRAAAEAQGKIRGFGWAHYCERVAGSWGESAWLELRPDGRVTALLGSMSNGQGHETAFAQLLADQLGVDFNDIDVVQGDTDRIPSGHGTGGSASIPICSVALREASIDLIAKALPLAADALEAAPVDVAFEDGAFRIVGTDRRVTLSAVAGRLPADAMLGGTGAWKPDGPTFPNGCHVAEVEIDPETGAWTLERYTMLHDFGRVLNPMMLEGQLQGGVAQGVGQAAMERVVHDPESGQVLSGSFMDYQIPRADELPALVLETLPTNAPTHPLGIKGCGEAGAAGGAPAVMNALVDAIAHAGGGALDMPATPERVWRALRRG
ncbi:MAG: xanthine dehydrogenase family protein molybdopterin-binding subunit [Acetobacteraceae bacterium]|nr:xanthine dehydrogenase family protein molybdopterin-binding subunit [Acetobacteraceae bacterium]